MADPNAARLMNLIFGFVPAQVVRVMATLGLADLLAGGPLCLRTLTKLSGSHEPSLRRLLRGAIHLGLVVQNEKGAYELAPAGQLLRGDTQDSVKCLAMQMAGEPTWSALGRIEHTVRTGQPSVQHVFGRSSYSWLEENPDSEALFYQWMTDLARQDVPRLVRALDLSGVRDVVDVGGGNGVLMSGLLAANRALNGTIFDRAASLEHTAAVLDDVGVTGRCALVAGDFLTDPLPAGRDLYLIKNTVSDWGDEDVVRILRACHQAMRADSRLFVIDMVLPEGETEPDPVALMSDLCTLACGGAIRTEREFGDLFAAAGLRLSKVGGDQAQLGVSILHAVRN